MDSLTSWTTYEGETATAMSAGATPFSSDCPANTGLAPEVSRPFPFAGAVPLAPPGAKPKPLAASAFRASYSSSLIPPRGSGGGNTFRGAPAGTSAILTSIAALTAPCPRSARACPDRTLLAWLDVVACCPKATTLKPANAIERTSDTDLILIVTSIGLREGFGWLVADRSARLRVQCVSRRSRTHTCAQHCRSANAISQVLSEGKKTLGPEFYEQT